MRSASRNYKVYKSRFEHRGKAKPPPPIFEYELRGIASEEAFVAAGVNLKAAIARHFETVLMRNVSGISFYCKHGRDWYSVTRNETKIEVKKVY